VDLVAHRSPFRVHHALRRGGRYAMVGGLVRILLGTAVAGPLVGGATGKRVGVLVVPQSRAELEAVTALVAQGAVTPRIDHVYPLRDARAAFARLAAGESQGKLVIEVSEG
jgi:NADPH:quinone reductase-like Zn-dependent oxidoreductase